MATSTPTNTDIKNHTSAYAEKLGIHCTHAERGTAIYEMPYREDNTTVADLVHGGALLSLADIAITGAVWSEVDEPEKFRGVTVSLNHSFVAGARSSKVSAKAEVCKRGRSLCFCRFEITDEQGSLVAEGSATYKLSRQQSPAEIMAGVFQNKSSNEQMQVLAELERTGASVYEMFAEQVEDDALKTLLHECAERERANADVLSDVHKNCSGGE